MVEEFFGIKSRVQLIGVLNTFVIKSFKESFDTTFMRREILTNVLSAFVNKLFLETFYEK